MKILKSHLLEKVDAKLNVKQLEAELTRLGLEVESIEKFGNSKKSDFVIDLDLTPNRGDCFSVLGVARELAAISNKEILKEKNILKKASLSPLTKVKLSEKLACPKYSFIEIHKIDNTKKLPEYISNRLDAAGINLINPIVDILNYVMIDLGQPLHAFDLDKIGKSINVRFAKPKEKISLLDGSNKILNKNCLVISDEKKALALAGIMGGIDSSVQLDSCSVLIESAFFDPLVIQGKARSFNIQTDSSQRFERGVDFDLQQKALIKATNLIADHLSGSHSQVKTIEAKKFIPRKKVLNIDLNNLNKKLGTKLKAEEIKKILNSLEINTTVKKDLLCTMIPSHRFDLNIEEDLIEEVARMIGYDNLPSSELKTFNKFFVPTDYQETSKIKKYIANQGFQEVINYSFVSEKILNDYNLSKNSISVKNPLNENLEVMRTSLLPGLLNNLKLNFNRGENSLKIFEEGRIFSNKNNSKEQKILAGLIFDHDGKKNWNNKTKFDFFELKKFIITLLNNLSLVNFNFKKSLNNFLHPNISLDVYVKGKKIGSFGRSHPKVNKIIGIKKDFFYFEFELEELFQKEILKISESSKYPSIQRDLSFLIPENVEYERLKALAEKMAGKELVGLKLFDLYKNSGVQEASSSYALNFTWQSKHKTLRDVDIDLVIEKIIKAFKKEFNASLRS